MKLNLTSDFAGKHGGASVVENEGVCATSRQVFIDCAAPAFAPEHTSDSAIAGILYLSGNSMKRNALRSEDVKEEYGFAQTWFSLLTVRNSFPQPIRIDASRNSFTPRDFPPQCYKSSHHSNH